MRYCCVHVMCSVYACTRDYKRIYVLVVAHCTRVLGCRFCLVVLLIGGVFWVIAADCAANDGDRA